MRSFGLIFWLLGSWHTSMAHPPLTPAQIFDRTTAVYRSVTSYQDTGEVVTHNRSKERRFYEPGDYTSRTPFQTAFVRKTGQFRFRYEHVKPQKPEIAYVIWSDGKRVKTWNWMDRKAKEDEPIRSAILIAAGVSLSSSVRVPGLLLGFDALSWNLKDIKKRVAMPQMLVAGKTCYHLRGIVDRIPYDASAKSPVPIKEPTESHPTIDIWIDTTTFLLIRISQTYNRGAESIELTTTFYPLLNQPVKPESLAFDYEHF